MDVYLCDAIVTDQITATVAVCWLGLWLATSQTCAHMRLFDCRDLFDRLTGNLVCEAWCTHVGDRFGIHKAEHTFGIYVA